jgi:beta-galactosidase/beta-glucuronidase
MKACLAALKGCLVFALTISVNTYAQQFIAKGRKALAVIATRTTNVKTPVISLNGVWEINTDPGENVWKTNTGHWKKINVPGEPAMQGFTIENDKEFFYRTTITVPADAANKSVLIRFNGVYSYARVFVNGKFVREHFGGFTAWDADISEFVKAGEKAVVYIGVTDRVDDISYASGYAHHIIGGILREVQLLLLPKVYINRFYIQTDLSQDFKKATISLNIAKSNETPGGKIKFQLYDPNGKAVLHALHEFTLHDNGQAEYSFDVQNPRLWNEEQPLLYTLKAEFINKGKTQEKIEQKIGIRKIKVDGKRLLVNGMPVKLRGACRHDMHPLLGRSTNRYYDSLDVVLAKEANINFIRTSHYPPSQDFLEFADRYGLYVQEETAVCFVSKGRLGIYKPYGETYNDTSYTSRYLGQLSEMIDRDRNHAAVIIWSIGNESTYGLNFQKEYEFVKSVDVSRPVSWSFPGTAIRQNKRCFDIAIAHYPRYNGTDTANAGLRYKNMEHDSLPLLSDEWAHVPCYNTTLLKMDPNINDFWGRSLDSMWANRFDVPGNLGGAIWGMIDETFYLPDSVKGYGPWGIVDVWRRKKPEFWNTKKAYSPVRILQTHFENNGTNQLINIPVKNRFNHLSLKQIRLKITANHQSYFLPLPDLKPHEEGTIPVKAKADDRSLLLQFFGAGDLLLDEEQITLSANTHLETKKASLRQWNIIKNGDLVTLKQKDLLIQFNALTGQLVKADVRGSTVLTAAPKVIISQPKDPNSNYETSAIISGAYKTKDAVMDTNNKKQTVVTSRGTAGNYPITMVTCYNADGTIQVSYEADSIPDYTWQIGIAFPVNNSFDKIKWKRKGYWTTYPANHIAAIEGTALRYTNCKEPYRTRPDCIISKSRYDYFLSKTIAPEKANTGASEAYRGTKEDILSMNLMGGTKTIRLISNGHQAAKMDILSSGEQELLVMDKWDYWGLGWGNFAGTKNFSSVVKGTVTLQLVQ